MKIKFLSDLHTMISKNISIKYFISRSSSLHRSLALLIEFFARISNDLKLLSASSNSRVMKSKMPSLKKLKKHCLEFTGMT